MQKAKGRRWNLLPTVLAAFGALVFCLIQVPIFSAEPSAKAITVQVLDYDGLQKLIASKKGKVVVMDCWATSCAPCVAEFPKLVAINKQYGPEKVACISLSFDYDGSDKLDEVRSPVQKFLERQGATFDNVLSSVPADELCKKLDLPSIPAVYVFGKDGKLAKRFEGSKAYDEVPALVEELVAGNR